MPENQEVPRASLLLALPIEIRLEIFRNLLPSDSPISYQCPFGIFDTSYVERHEERHEKPPPRRQCGQGPGWSCLQAKKGRPLDILLTCSQLYEDCAYLLYHRTFWIDVADGTFFLLNMSEKDKEEDWTDEEELVHKGQDKVARVVFSRMKCVGINVEIPSSREEFLDIQAALERLCSVLAKAERIKTLQLILWIGKTPESISLKLENIKGLLRPFRDLENMIGEAKIGVQVSPIGISDEIVKSAQLINVPKLELILDHPRSGDEWVITKGIDLSTLGCCQHLFEELNHARDETEDDDGGLGTGNGPNGE